MNLVNARDYDPQIQRWTTQDPMGFAAGDPNLFRMVSNNPTNLTDPSGLDAMSWLLGDQHTGWFAQVGNTASGFADTITAGAVGRVQDAMGTGAMVDRGGDAYRYGTYGGQAWNLGRKRDIAYYFSPNNHRSIMPIRRVGRKWRMKVAECSRVRPSGRQKTNGDVPLSAPCWHNGIKEKLVCP